MENSKLRKSTTTIQVGTSNVQFRKPKLLDHLKMHLHIVLKENKTLIVWRFTWYNVRNVWLVKIKDFLSSKTSTLAPVQVLERELNWDFSEQSKI